MLINVHSTENPQTLLFVFSETNSVFPLKQGEDKTFYAASVVKKHPEAGLLSNEDAVRLGYDVADTLLTNQKVNNVTLFVSGQQKDVVTVTLKDEYNWNDPLQKPVVPVFSARTLGNLLKKTPDKTLKDSILERLTQEFGLSKNALYHAPKTGLNPQDIVDKANRYITSEKDESDIHANVFNTMSGDKGQVRAIKFDPDKRELTMIFSGSCSTGCSKGDTSFTETGLKAAMRRPCPEARIFKFIKQ